MLASLGTAAKQAAAAYRPSVLSAPIASSPFSSMAQDPYRAAQTVRRGAELAVESDRVLPHERQQQGVRLEAREALEHGTEIGHAQRQVQVVYDFAARLPYIATRQRMRQARPYVVIAQQW